MRGGVTAFKLTSYILSHKAFLLLFIWVERKTFSPPPPAKQFLGERKENPPPQHTHFPFLFRPLIRSSPSSFGVCSFAFASDDDDEATRTKEGKGRSKHKVYRVKESTNISCGEIGECRACVEGQKKRKRADINLDQGHV